MSETGLQIIAAICGLSIGFFVGGMMEQAQMQKRAVAHECAVYQPPDGDFVWKKALTDD